MCRNLKNFRFIVAVALLLVSTKELVAASTNISLTLSNLLLFGWGVFCCVRVDEEKNQYRPSRLVREYYILV